MEPARHAHPIPSQAQASATGCGTNQVGPASPLATVRPACAKRGRTPSRRAGKAPVPSTPARPAGQRPARPGARPPNRPAGTCHSPRAKVADALLRRMGPRRARARPCCASMRAGATGLRAIPRGRRRCLDGMAGQARWPAISTARAGGPGRGQIPRQRLDDVGRPGCHWPGGSQTSAEAGGARRRPPPFLPAQAPDSGWPCRAEAAW